MWWLQRWQPESWRYDELEVPGRGGGMLREEERSCRRRFAI
jgi:hypothetical protein